MQGKLIRTAVVIVLVLGGWVVLNHTFPENMPDNCRLGFKWLGALAGVTAIAYMWMPNRRKQ
jgi:hypothetical protein